MAAGSAEPGSSSDGSGQGGRDGWLSRFNVGGSSEQGGVFGPCDCAGVVADPSARTARAPAKQSQRA